MTKLALRVFIGSISLSALLGVVVLLGGDFGEVEVKILVTTLCVSGASILSMASAVALERGKARVYPWVGIACSIVGFATLLWCVWFEEGDDVLLKLVITLIIAGSAGAHGSLLLLANLPAGRRWALVATLVLGALTAFVGTLLVWNEGDGEGLFRALGTFAILTTAGTLIVPVMQRLEARGRGETDAGGPPRCPHCGGALSEELVRRALRPGSGEGGRLG